MMSRTAKWALWLMIGGCHLSSGQAPQVQSPPLTLKRLEIKVPLAEAGDAGLQTVVILPSTPGRHPLVMMTHGSDYTNGKNHQMGPGMMQPAALWFARRGWVVAIVLRRGYGASGGKMDKTHYGCDEGALASIAEENSADLMAAYEIVKKLPHVDGTSVIVTGNSAGGFAALALGAHAPPALKAVINFSGGWHSLFFGGSCAKSGLIPEFRNLGAATHVPTLWLYAKNDSFFAPKYVALMHEAFTGAGGQAEMPLIGESGDDGHYLLTEGVEIWGPMVEEFLDKHALPWQDLAPELKGEVIKLPDAYPSDMKDAFIKWQKMGSNKAFAIGPNGEWGYSSGRKTLKIAEDEALGRCRNSQRKIVASDGR